MDFHENFLQMVWKYQYFNSQQLQTIDQQSLTVKKIGYHNNHEGPDFMEAQIIIDGIEYFGHVEIHIKSSDWKNHNHDMDSRYNAVVLHVVWEADKSVNRLDGTCIPTLELKGKILLHVLRNYQLLTESKSEILCKNFLSQVHEIQKFSMIEKSLVERMDHKSAAIYSILQATQFNWEETAYRWLFYCFGFKTNSSSMLALAESVPYLLIRKIGAKSQLLQALFLGQAGFLPSSSDDEYIQWLIQEYQFLKIKNNLIPQLHPHHWKMVGVRPKNFPVIRIIQLCEMMANHPHLFSLILEENNPTSLLQTLFNIELPSYWQSHYFPGKKSSSPLSKHLSSNIQNLIKINFYIPLGYAYEKYLQKNDFQEKPFNLLQNLKKEQNSIIKKFSDCHWNPLNAYDSQGMIGLYQNYCRPKRCLMCKIGHSILKQP
jgi:hypothetical protein